MLATESANVSKKQGARIISGNFGIVRFRAKHGKVWKLTQELHMASKIKSYAEEDMKWRAESDLRTLIEASAIRKDKKRFAKVRELAKENTMKMATIATDSDSDE